MARLGAQVRFEQVIPRLGRRVIAVS